MHERKSTIHDETALGSGDKTFGSSTCLVEMNQRGGVSNIQGLKIEIFEDELVHGTLNGGEGEEGFGEEEGRI